MNECKSEHTSLKTELEKLDKSLERLRENVASLKNELEFVSIPDPTSISKSPEVTSLSPCVQDISNKLCLVEDINQQILQINKQLHIN
jgi:archaellum component FlaC